MVQAHPEEAVSLCAEGLPVEEIAPAADALANEEAQQDQIQRCGKLDFLHLAECPHTGHRAQHAAVNGDAAVPDVQHGDGVPGKFIPGEGAVVGPGAQNGEGGHPQHAVQHMVLRQAEFLGPLGAVQNRQHQADGDDQAVIMDGQGAEFNGSVRIQFDPQSGEGDHRKISGSHSFPPKSDLLRKYTAPKPPLCKGRWPERAEGLSIPQSRCSRASPLYTRGPFLIPQWDKSRTGRRFPSGSHPSGNPEYLPSEFGHRCRGN